MMKKYKTYTEIIEAKALDYVYHIEEMRFISNYNNEVSDNDKKYCF